MGEDKKPSGKDSRQNSDGVGQDTEIASGGHNQLMQHPPNGWYPLPADEIDLAALVGILYRRKWLILGLTILSSCLAFAATFLMDKKYKATSIIELGQIQRAVGHVNDSGSVEYEYKYVEPPGAVAEKLRSLAKQLYSTSLFEADAAFSIKNDLNISSSKEGAIVELTLEAPKSSEAIEFLTRLNQSLIAEHERIINIERQKLKTDMDNLQSKAAEYQGRKISYQKRLESLKEEGQFLQEQIQSTNRQIEQILAIKAKASLESENEPLGQLLFSNEMHRIQAHKDQLNTRLISGIPKEREDLIMQVYITESEIQTLENNLEMMQVRLDNIISTRVLLPPRFSKNPVSPDLKLNLALGLITGVVLSVFLVFIIEFWQKNKEKIKAGSK